MARDVPEFSEFLHGFIDGRFLQFTRKTDYSESIDNRARFSKRHEWNLYALLKQFQLRITKTPNAHKNNKSSILTM